MARAAALLDGVCLGPGQVLSWHEEVGPPLRVRGFARGPELHDGQVARGAGGGVCQVANLVFWLAVHGGLEVVERHRHALDLFPDQHRTVPFGLGATVFWPHRDLKLRNPHEVAVCFGLWVSEGRLWGSLSSEAALGARWEVVEAWHRFRREGAKVYRENRLDRVTVWDTGLREVSALCEHSAVVTYPLPAGEAS